MYGNSSATTTDLLARIKSGDESAFDELYLSLFTPLYEYALRLSQDPALAEDMVQDVFQLFWRDRTSRDIHSNIRVYLFSALKKRALNHRRHTKVVQRVESLHDDDDMIPGFGSQAPCPDAALQSHDINALIDSFLDSMPDDRREVLLLRWRHGMSYDEISQIIGISVSAAQAQVSRAQRALRPILKDLLA